ncbi:MAG: insulinase family protein [Chitinophagales bacterium]
MKKNLIPLFLSCLFLLAACSSEKSADAPEYPYESVEGDPLDTRIYTLDNGLKVYLSVNKKEPKIQTNIAVRTGSKNDPPETTGLAHYLEHMLFKGTDEFGTINWEKEKPLLDSISALYELHRKEADPEKKKALYAKIDSVSYQASKYAAPNEYDKMISSIGGSGTNAYTWVDQTVYVNNIPANELEKWLELEAERFSTLVLRLFHTELETVYEEFNRSQDSDFRKSFKNLNEGLYPKHPYGTQTTIGEGEHLKNPSLVNIHNYFNTYYQPNNTAICLAGDLDFDETIKLIDKHFGSWEANEIPEFELKAQPEITEPIVKTALGSQPEHLYIGFRFDKAGSREAMMMRLVSGILMNGSAGLVDLDLLQKQKVLKAASYESMMHDFSSHMLFGMPRQGQDLEEVKDLLLAQLDSIKQGNFDDWLVQAVVRDFKLQDIKSYENNNARVSKFVNSFVVERPWEDIVKQYEVMEKITKEDVVEFANKHYGNNYVVSYKRLGEDTTVHKVDKPQITSIEIDREGQSDFFKAFEAKETPRLEPQFIDYESEIKEDKLASDIPFYYTKNEENELFNLYYILDMGEDHDKEMALAVSYLPYLGTEKYSPEDLQKEFFKLGLDFSVNTGRYRTYVKLSGLQESFEKGVELFEHLLASVQPEEAAYTEMVKGILKDRADQKLQKGVILRQGLFNFAKYGEENPFTNILSEDKLKSIDPNALIQKINALTSYQHKVFYYGPEEKSAVKKVLDKLHKVPAELKAYPEPLKFEVQRQSKDEVYFVDYDMVQTEMIILATGQEFTPDLMTFNKLFNEYFGAGLSSIVFQEIRESKALAYAAYAYQSTPRRADEPFLSIAYIGTQSDKLQEASSEMLKLLNTMPKAEKQFKAAKESAMKNIESERTVGDEIFWSYQRLLDLGIDYDINKKLYEEIPSWNIDKMEEKFQEEIAGKKHTFLVIGKKEDMDLEVLKNIGTFKELSLEEVFNY